MEEAETSEKQGQAQADDLKAQPEFVDEFFRKRPKKGKGEWKIVDSPHLQVAVADTHCHLDMLQNPPLALARAGANHVGFIETMVDPLGSEGIGIFDDLDDWIREAALLIRQMSTRICGQGWKSVPKVRISVGVHPHVSKGFSDSTLEVMANLLRDPRVSAVGEIGLDYHYDLSPRKIQKDVFAAQVNMAKEAGLPVILHVREAFDDAFQIMDGLGWSDDGVLLHCYTSDEREVTRWAQAGCYIAFGGALTFKKLEEVRQASKLVPKNRILLETDAPFMTPEPFRGMECEPAHVVWTAERLYEEAALSDEGFREFFERVYENSLGLLDRKPTSWQLGD